MKNAIIVEGVHTHTHTHTGNLVNKKRNNKIKGRNIILVSKACAS